VKALGSRAVGSWLPVLLAIAIIAVVALALYDYWAVREWRRSAAALADRAAYDSAALLVTALTRDMRGAQMLVLANRDTGNFATQTSAEASDQVATAFTRFPYPESFFAWRRGDPDLLFFNRVNREPSWAHGSPDSLGQSVVVVRTAPFGREWLARLKEDALSRRSYTFEQTSIGEDPYQIVARLEYSDSFRDQLERITGFTVNLSWVREEYFPEIVAQVARIGQRGVTLDYSIIDEAAKPVVGKVVDDPATTFDLPLQFFDPWTSDATLATSAAPVVWKVRVSAANDPSLLSATRGADWTVLAIAATALVLLAGLFITAYAIEASASTAAMRADFVATVTHNLKTPLATIRAVADTMVRRPLAAGTARKYGATLVQESRQLSRLVDNALAYARVTDVTEIYSFEKVSAAELIEDTLAGFRQQLFDGGFEVVTDVPHDLPPVRGDRTALRLALDNLVDNAIRYSATSRWIGVSAQHSHSSVTIEVRDRGVGIPPDEIEAVQKKFVRGRQSSNSGTGLGLTIVRRVARDHSGQFELRSQPGEGTTAALVLSAWR
jgi:signal transduction histidine kinase